MKRLHHKHSSRCGWPQTPRCRKRALKRLNGNGYDSYCRDHKRQRSREYMKARRAVDPKYGQGRFR